MAPVAVVTRKERILVVDDEEGMRELLVTLFRKNGYQTAAAPDANTAFDLISEMEPHVVITDYRIAGGGGIELIRAIGWHFPDVKCVFMTAFDSPELMAEAVDAGAAVTLQKPFDILTILAEVQVLTGPDEPPEEV